MSVLDSTLFKRIESSSLTLLEKADLVEALATVPEEIMYWDAVAISCAFAWTRTQQGAEYWDAWNARLRRASPNV